jgi:transposase-like protein
MSSPPPGISLSAMARPRCPQCHSRMMLVGVSLGAAGDKLQHFECGKCDHARTGVAEQDPMKSRAAGWLFGDLKPPE